MKEFLRNSAFTLLLAMNVAPGFGQTTEEMIKRFPNEHAILLNNQREVKISYKNNVPYAESRVESEIMILDDKANGIYNKYKVYHGSFNELKNLDAFTRVPDGSKFKKMKVTDVKTQDASSNSVFYDDTKETTFDFPAIAKGSIASVSYEELHKDVHLLTPFYFSSYMPALSSRLKVTCPSNMQLKYVIKNDDQKKITVREEKNGRQVSYEFVASDIKPKDQYNDAPPHAYYEPHVIFYLATYKNEQGEEVKFLNDVDDLYKWNSHFLADINTQEHDALKHLADSLTKGVSTERIKAEKIYKWVQENIKYIAFENGLEGFRPRQAADVLSKKYGDCKDMASLLTALCRSSGLQAYFTWIGTRDIPYQYTQVPLPLTDNHMISTVKINDEWIFLDGTDPNCVFGMPSKAIQGKQSMIAISDKEYKIVVVPEQKSSNNYVVDSTFISITDAGIKGNSSVYYYGYFGNDAYNTLQYRDVKDTREYVKSRMSKGSNKFMLGDYTINTAQQPDKILHLKANFDLPDYGKKIANEYYINLNLEKFFTNAQIDTSKRKIPMNHDFRYSVQQYTVLEVPKDYTVTYLPEDYTFNNNLFSFTLTYKQVDNKVIATQLLSSECLMLEPADFVKWNNTVKELNNQYKKQLVLARK